MNLFNVARAHEGAGEEGGIQGVMHIDPADHPVVGQEAKFFFTFTDPDKLFNIEHCDCKVFLFKGQDIIDQHQVSAPTGFAAALTSAPMYTKVFSDPGDYSIHFSGQPKQGYNFDAFALHFDFHVYQPGEAAQTNTTDHSEHTGTDHGQGWQHLLSEHHLGHGIIFGGGLVASIILLIYGILEKRRQAKK